MFYIYVLQSREKGSLYVGYTANLKRRMKEHLNGKCYTTSHMGEIELIHYEAYKAQSDAIRREDYLKTTQGKRMLKLMLKDTLSSPDVVK